MQTADLLARAEQRTENLSALARALGLKANTLNVAKARGRLSPAVAAALAAHLGEPVAAWTMAAVIEGERSAPLRRKLAALARGISYVSTLVRRAQRTVCRFDPTAAATRAQVQPRARSSAACA